VGPRLAKGDRVLKGGYFMNELPQWFLKKKKAALQELLHLHHPELLPQPRFTIIAFGLLGPVRIIAQD
jgi:hypothetical protein